MLIILRRCAIRNFEKKWSTLLDEIADLWHTAIEIMTSLAIARLAKRPFVLVKSALSQ
jgi:hypothetical protein